MSERSSQDDLSPQQQDAIIALMSEPSIQKVADRVGVNEKTVRRWMEEPAFMAAYRKAQRQTYGQGTALLQRYASMAVNTLAKVMTDSGSPAHARVTAATAILKLGREGIELDDLTERIETLEQASDNTGAKNWRYHSA